MNLPFTSQSHNTPDLEEILNRLQLDEQHLGKLSLQPKGVEEAIKYAENVFETQYGDDIQRALGNAASQKQEVIRFENDLTKAQDHVSTLERKLDISDEDKAKSPMSITTMAVQFFLAAMTIFLLGLGAHNFAVLLIKTGEPFLTSPWMAYVTAFSAATMFAVVMEAFVCMHKHEGTKRFVAMTSLAIGVVCGLCYLAILSHIVPPDFTEADVASLIPSLDGPGTPVVEAEVLAVVDEILDTFLADRIEELALNAGGLRCFVGMLVASAVFSRCVALGGFLPHKFVIDALGRWIVHGSRGLGSCAEGGATTSVSEADDVTAVLGLNAD